MDEDVCEVMLVSDEVGLVVISLEEDGELVALLGLDDSEDGLDSLL